MGSNISAVQAEYPSTLPAVISVPVHREFTHLPWRRRATWVVILGSLTAVGAFTIDLYLPAFPQMQRQLHAGTVMVQLTLTGMMIGLAVGQLIVGPLTDALGRRRPLLAGLVLHFIASLACAAAPNIALLAAARICQGAGVAAASVIALAIVRDRFQGAGAARLIARLMLIVGVSPIFAPSVGGALIPITGWRGIFIALGVLSLSLSVAVAWLLPETLPPGRRRAAGLRGILRAYRDVLADGPTVWLVAVAALSMAAVFGYVGGSSFVFQQQFKLSGHLYGLVFAIGGLFLIAGSQVSGSLVHRYSPRSLLTVSLATASVCGVLLIVAAATGLLGLTGVLLPTWLLLGAFGLGQPTGPAIALERHPDAAGTTAAVLGSLQFAMAALAAPAAGLFDASPALGMAVVITTGTLLALTVYLLAVRPRLV